ncbi:MAG: hypothetical protein A2Y17_11065 [Clostridiales bacterium GWF2_38_85]|nr:MAG: hypothetical protein A2Y17_11065 [Clostridiales bacterium GWF2_38_85]HBL84666.1 hypothetical protein [Clostridiales bacterium]
MERLTLHIPAENELEYHRHLISDEKTMSYNQGYGDNVNGCYYQTIDQVREWYKNWNNGTDNYYAYIIRNDDNVPVGEVDIHYSNCCKKYIIGVVIEYNYRGNGYSIEALRLLADHAFNKMKLNAIYDYFSSERKTAEHAFLKVGFVRINDELVELTKDRYEINKISEKESTNISITDYLKAPCKLLSIPFWKAKNLIPPNNILILHNDIFSEKLLDEYNDITYFRIIHTLNDVQEPAIPTGFTIKTLNSTDVAEVLTNHINQCYDDINVTSDYITGLMKQSVHCQDLWIGIYNDLTSEITASGIAEFDAETKEGSLEWIQTSPDYRNKGFGQAVVNELLIRLRKKALFVTVSGKINNKTHPEAMYRICGFVGNDIWHILTKKEIKNAKV